MNLSKQHRDGIRDNIQALNKVVLMTQNAYCHLNELLIENTLNGLPDNNIPELADTLVITNTSARKIITELEAELQEDKNATE